jgi:hypothetical protein
VVIAEPVVSMIQQAFGLWVLQNRFAQTQRCSNSQWSSCCFAEALSRTDRSDAKNGLDAVCAVHEVLVDSEDIPGAEVQPRRCRAFILVGHPVGQRSVTQLSGTKGLLQYDAHRFLIEISKPD